MRVRDGVRACAVWVHKESACLCMCVDVLVRGSYARACVNARARWCACMCGWVHKEIACVCACAWTFVYAWEFVRECACVCVCYILKLSYAQAELGYEYECPDFFALPTKHTLPKQQQNVTYALMLSVDTYKNVRFLSSHCPSTHKKPERNMQYNNKMQLMHLCSLLLSNIN